ncbi:MAG: hypothetical protein JSU63_10075, partial [Phycisphaerales bacterium]
WKMLAVLCGSVVQFGLASQVFALVDLELRGPTGPVVAGMTFEVGLYVVADPAEVVGDVAAVITWDQS